MVFLLLQVEGPGSPADIEQLMRHLRNPAVCSDPMSALSELRAWYASMTYAVTLGTSLPDVTELYRAGLSIVSLVFESHPDGALQFRWNNCFMQNGGSHIQSLDALDVVLKFAKAELEQLVLSGQKGLPRPFP